MNPKILTVDYMTLYLRPIRRAMRVGDSGSSMEHQLKVLPRFLEAFRTNAVSVQDDRASIWYNATVGDGRLRLLASTLYREAVETSIRCKVCQLPHTAIIVMVRPKAMKLCWR